MTREQARALVRRYVALARAEWKSAHRTPLIYEPTLHGTDEEMIRFRRETTAMFWLLQARHTKKKAAAL